ncbi:MAG: hypothetical protein A3I24_02885 [Candidatus Harrisonbacteria bacterium RIFCSPLOWO2_02_FULL_41_13b]|uniref:Uncharacterized protein n=1 Tax=Candidatus Harrisonbacteria bacterium RIFCSPLOWO2_02_FULL_41_13b TaxID=1798409 RepID=A0A1G1ZTL8_9BACT|nr:MAG: hypothetical protein A3I24_02885 [Candidatus Harrisonbacteria bacterium RIFCSPLOWO2_02_FULL_41_13b]
MKTIFLFIPHYVFSSDLLHTDFIKGLSKSYQVIIFSPIFKSNPPENYYQSPNLKYIIWSEEYPKFWLFFTKTLRLALIREFDQLKYFQLRRLMKINLNWQRKLLRTISWFIPRKLLTVDFFTKLEYWLLPASKKFRAYAQKYHPHLIITCTPGFNSIDAEAIIQAKKLKLPTASINSSWDNYTANAVQFRKTDYLVSWNKVMKKEAIEIHHYPENHLFVSGVYRFDHHFQHMNSTPSPNDSGNANAPTRIKQRLTREEFLKNKGLDPQLKTLFLTTVPPNTYPPQYEVWRQIIKMREEKKLREDVNIFIRLHPNDLAEKYTEFQGLKNLHIELAGKKLETTGSSPHKIEMDESDLDNLRYSLKYTDININFRSSLSLEATIYDQPMINIALYDYANRYDVDWYIPIIKSGGVKLVVTAEELKQAINDYLTNPKLDSEGRKKIFADYVIFNDGQSYQRGIAAINSIISQLTP